MRFLGTFSAIFLKYGWIYKVLETFSDFIISFITNIFIKSDESQTGDNFTDEMFLNSLTLESVWYLIIL